MRRQVGHKAPNAGLVLIERVLEGSGQVTRAAGLQPRTTSHWRPEALPPETGNKQPDT